MSKPLHIVLRCTEALLPKVRYVFDTLFMARGVHVVILPNHPQAVHGSCMVPPKRRHGRSTDVWPSLIVRRLGNSSTTIPKSRPLQTSKA